MRVVFVLVALRFLFRLLAAIVRTVRAPAQRPREAPPAPSAPAVGGELVRDRVCNTFLPRERALSATIDGQVEHFCSAACRDQALAGAAPGMRSR